MMLTVLSTINLSVQNETNMVVANNDTDDDSNSEEDKFGADNLEEIVEIGLRENDRHHGYWWMRVTTHQWKRMEHIPRN
jgi:hypothetical protein